MRIAGLHKTTLVDYPGRVACAVFTQGCNFHCPYCHNPELISPSAGEALPEAALFSFLESRRALLQGVVISGGEPTLHDDLPAFCARLKSLGYAIKLDTNGSRPAVLENLLTKALVDYVAMDLKSAPANYSSPPSPLCGQTAAKGIARSLELLRLWAKKGLEYELRTTCVSPFVSIETFPAMLRAVDKGARWYLQRARVEEDNPVLAPDFFRTTKEPGAPGIEAPGRALKDTELESLCAIAQKAGVRCEIR